MKRGSRLVTKQIVKYIVIILVGLLAIFFSKVMWALPDDVHIWGLVTVGVILFIGIVFDAWSTKDVLPFLKG